MNPSQLELVPQEKSSKTKFSKFANDIYTQKYALKDEDGHVIEDWSNTAFRVTKHVMGALGYSPSDEEFQKVLSLIIQRKFIPGGRYLYASGRDLHQVNNCLLLRAEDSREGWADLLSKAAMALQTGAGIGVDYSSVRASGSEIKKTGGVASGPLALMQMVNEIGRGVMQGGARRSAIWAGLNWQHKDCDEFIVMKDWSAKLREIKESDFAFPAPMEFTNISVLLDDDFFEAYDDEFHPLHTRAHRIYEKSVKQMLKTAEPGFSIDIGENAGETCRNACTELTSRDSDDICNLGSINISRLKSVDEFEEAIEYATLFLLAGTVYSHVPYPEVAEVREKNRRLGLGLMGIHEWLLQRGYRYEPNDELAEWLEVYSQSTGIASDWALKHDLTPPVKTRAIAPTGTIGILAETTTGLEPIFCIAYKRRYLSNGTTWKHQYVVDPTARRMIEENGVDPFEIEDAYSLSYNVERRLAMQAFIQKYVDHAISSTINLPYPVTEEAEVADYQKLLYKYLPQLRGITTYPDGARGGQPLTVASYQQAIESEGVVFEEENAACLNGVCGA